MIEVNELKKSYRIIDRDGSLNSLIKNIFFPKYKKQEAVKGISFNIEEGKIVGFIGQNGAGKSTTIKMMTGILSPDSGSIRVLGLDPIKNKKEFAKNIGIVFGQRTQLWWDIPVVESFKLFKKMYKVSDEDYKNRMKQFDKILNINEFINKPTRQLSLGQRVRADICASLIHNPKILFLDEPTIGLDIVVKEKIRNFIKEINEKNNTTVILTTHDIDDIEKMSDSIILIDKGRIIYDGNIQNLKKQFSKCKRINIETGIFMKELLTQKMPNIKIVEEKCNAIEIEYEKELYDDSFVFENILKCGEVKSIESEENSLEDIIKEIYIRQ